MAFMLAPAAIEGLTAVIALAAAGTVAVAAADMLAQVPASTSAPVPRTRYWDGPTIFSGSPAGGGGGSNPRPPKRPPPSKKKIMAACLAGMMANYLEKRRPTRNGADGPLVDGPLGYHSRVSINIRLKDKLEWCGHFKKGPPQNVQRQVDAKEPEKDLIHQGALPQGSKAGLAYAADGTQWIVAWHAPLNGDPKIYVECGDEAPIDWSRIEKELDASRNTSECENASAEIIRDGKDAVIFVVFCT